jgi:DNA-binding PadR family transcriptional regulator
MSGRLESDAPDRARKPPVADKLTQHITDALGRAAAEPAGLPLFAARGDPGLFPTTAKPAAHKAVSDGLLYVARTETKGKATRELHALTEKGWDHLLAAVNPRQVLEDFVRALEARQGEVGELLGTARRMAESLHGLREAVARVLPQVTATRVFSRDAESAERSVPAALRSADSASRLSGNPTGTSHMNGTALLEPPVETRTELAEAVLARLADWSGAAGEDCPLPELFRSLTTREPPPTIGEFHDCLRKLHAGGAIYLHPWTGPLYALPEPAVALLVGHGVAYYASPR